MSKMKKIILYILFLNIFVYGGDVFIDKKTGLIWQDNDETKTVRKKWEGTKKYCQHLNLNNFKEWRLPNKVELSSLYRHKKRLQNLAESNYWAVDVKPSDSSKSFGIDFYNGNKYWFPKSIKGYVRCVRSIK